MNINMNMSTVDAIKMIMSDFSHRPLWAITVFRVMVAQRRAESAVKPVRGDEDRHIDGLLAPMQDHLYLENMGVLHNIRQKTWRQLHRELSSFRGEITLIVNKLEEVRAMMDEYNAHTSDAEEGQIEEIISEVRKRAYVVELGPEVAVHARFGEFGTHPFDMTVCRNLPDLLAMRGDLKAVVAAAEEEDASHTEEQRRKFLCIMSSYK